MKAAHKIVAFVLSLSMIMAMAVPSAVWLHFAQNRAEIAATQCEKKAEPANCCQGRCVLDKQIKKVENASKQSDNQSEEASEVKLDWTFDPIDNPDVPKWLGFAKAERPLESAVLLEGFSDELLDPPKAV